MADSVSYSAVLATFNAWLEEARERISHEYPNAFVLSTQGEHGLSSRIVLLKQHDAQGFYFFTNYESAKSVALAQHPLCALNFYWPELHKQIRIEGVAIKAAEDVSDAYFATRSRESQIGAWASLQSAPLPYAQALSDRIREFELQFNDQPVPRPPHWGGWCVVPKKIEFWEEGSHRLHSRTIFTRLDETQWEKTALFP